MGQLAGYWLVGVSLLGGLVFLGMAASHVASTIPVARQADKVGGGLAGLSIGAYLSLECVNWVQCFAWGVEILAGSFLLRREADLLQLATLLMDWVNEIGRRML